MRTFASTNSVLIGTVVLIDVVMPGVDGFQLAAMIREHPRFQKLAIIFVSAVQVAETDHLRGYEIGAAAVMLGTDEHPTPTGVFPILSKERHNVSEKYGDAPMPWSLRLTHDGVAIHGGSEVERGYASHGCIGSPDAFVSRLFAIAKVGDKVIITRGKTASLGDRLI